MDVNDFIWNVTGGILGYGIFRLISRVPAFSSLIERFQWRDTSSAPDPLAA